MVIEKSYPIERKHSRTDFSDTPWLFSLELTQEHRPSHTLRLEARNICLGGMKFCANYRLPLHLELQIDLLDKNSKLAPLRIRGKVIRVEETDTGAREKIYGMALKFDAFDAQTQAKLSAIL